MIDAAGQRKANMATADAQLVSTKRRLPLTPILYRLASLYHLVKTTIFYRPQFGAMGPRTRIVKPILLLNTEYARLGRGVTFRNGARIELLVTPGCPAPELTIGDYTSFEQNVHLICRSRVHIGSKVAITANCAIVDVNHPYDDIHDPRKLSSRVEMVDRPVEIGDYTFVGMNCVILPGVTIGKHCVIGAGSIVTGQIPDYSVATGRPARVVRRYDFEAKKWVGVDGTAGSGDTSAS